MDAEVEVDLMTPDPREAKLPTWVRETFRKLRRELRAATREAEIALDAARIAAGKRPTTGAPVTVALADGTAFGLPGDVSVDFGSLTVRPLVTGKGIEVETVHALYVSPRHIGMAVVTDNPASSL